MCVINILWVCLRADLHSTTLLHATSLQQVYDIADKVVVHLSHKGVSQGHLKYLFTIS